MNHDPAFTRHLINSGVLVREHFCLIDVGCSGGITTPWTLFDPYFQAIGVDPQIHEVSRLNELNPFRGVRYEAAFIGLPESHPFKELERSNGRADVSGLYNRLSCAVAWEKNHENVPSQSNSINTAFTDRRCTVTELVHSAGLDSVDFIKIDTDGWDLEAAISSTEILESHKVLGLMIETQFSGRDLSTDNCFHNIDRFMRSQGFELFDLVPLRYTRRALPGRFSLDIAAQTDRGQIIWSDAVYLRDPVGRQRRGKQPFPLSPVKLAKLLMLYELFNLEDCAVELINECSEVLSRFLDLSRARDTLAKPLQVSPHDDYRAHVARFEADPATFFPRELNNS
jgi:Methyltransferase FkbM domain